jgi:hypothetical protein
LAEWRACRAIEPLRIASASRRWPQSLEAHRVGGGAPVATPYGLQQKSYPYVSRQRWSRWQPTESLCSSGWAAFSPLRVPRFFMQCSIDTRPPQELGKTLSVLQEYADVTAKKAAWCRRTAMLSSLSCILQPYAAAERPARAMEDDEQPSALASASTVIYFIRLVTQRREKLRFASSHR